MASASLAQTWAPHPKQVISPWCPLSVVRAAIAVHGLGEAQVLDALVGHVGPDGDTAFGAADVHDVLLVYELLFPAGHNQHCTNAAQT